MLVLKSRKIYLLICLFLFSLAIPASAQTTEQFLTLSDLHFDPFLSCQKQPCPLIQKLESAPISQWQSIFSKEDHSVSAYGKDSNYELILSSLKAASTEGKAANLRFVLVLGDFLAHNYREKYLQYSDNKTQAGYLLFVQKTLAFLNAAFLQAFPQCDVYMVIGNNDSFGGDYNVIPEGAFFKDFSQQGASLIHHQANRQAFLQTFPTAGYFAVNAPSQPNLRLIFLNSVLFSIKVKGQRLEHAASAQLDWLHQELQQAAQRKRKVLIAMHIPTGIDVYMTLLSPFRIAEFWKTAYSKRFLTELQQASSEIIGVFQGHIHADSFQILSTAGKKPLPFTGTPSISPIFGNNPAFKIYSYSS
ncbi:MAG TPA: hypothetical protein VLH77_03485, partial [Gammaproteobacteria bacterium]|nr:hypothetical protein [Gammaproteobacteria bacterium]